MTTARLVVALVLWVPLGLARAQTTSARDFSTRPNWTVTDTVPDDSRPGRVRCEIEGWAPVWDNELVGIIYSVEPRWLLGWYHERTPVSEREPLVERFLEEYARGGSGEKDWDELREWPELEKLSDHPNTFVALAAWALRAKPIRLAHSQSFFVDGFMQRLEAVGEDGPPLRMQRLCEIGGGLVSRSDPDRSFRVKQQAFKELMRACSRPDLDFASREYLWHHFIAEQADHNDAAFRDAWINWLDATPNIDPWIDNISRGVALVNEAWDERGNAFASQTSRAQLNAFSATLRRARVKLVNAWKIDPRHARTAVEMIEVTMGGGGTRGLSEQDWLARALAARADYTRAVGALRNALRPRWGGSLEAMADLGASCNREEYYDSALVAAGLDCFLEILLEGFEDGDPGLLFRETAWARNFIELYDGAARRRSTINDTTRDEYRSRIAILNVMLGRKELAIENLRALGDRYRPEAASGLYLFDVNPHSEVLPFEAPLSPLVSKALAAESDAKYDEAWRSWEQAYHEAYRKNSSDLMLLAALRDRVELCRVRAQLAGGRWVELSLASDRAGLRGTEAFEIVTDQSGVARLTVTDATDPLMMWVPVDLGVRYETELWFRRCEESASAADFSLLFDTGVTRWRNQPLGQMRFTVDPSGGFAGVTNQSALYNDKLKVRPDSEGWYRVRVTRDRDVISASVNGEPVVEVKRDVYGGPYAERPTVGFALQRHFNLPVELKGFRVRYLGPQREDE